MKKAATAIILIITLAMGALQGNAQEAKYKFDIGGGIGMSGYLGDVNESNMYKHPGISAEASFRYIANTRLAIRGIFKTVSLSGNSNDFGIVFPEGKSYEFSSWAYDLGGRIEFNFFGYGIGETYKRLKRWSPYLSIGAGVTMSSSDGNSSFAMNLPMGLGIKYKLRQRLNLGMEFTMTKVFGDKVDGEYINDLYQIKSSMIKNTDWYSTLTFSITYEFGERCETCHYVD